MRPALQLCGRFITWGLTGRSYTPHRGIGAIQSKYGGVVEEYPRNLSEFEAWFDTEQACRDYLFRLRWPEGFRCPRCGGGHFWPVRSALMQCQQCGHQTSVTAGTIFQDTRKPLVDWFRAMYWFASQKNGVSALGLQRVLGIGQLQDRLDVAAQVASSDGPAGA